MLHLGTTDPGYVSIFHHVRRLVRAGWSSRSSQALSKLDDRMLDDIGLRRTEFASAQTFPMQINAPMGAARSRKKGESLR